MTMQRPLPLNALRIFEVAARSRSYVEAAAELGLTHGAVSRQIATLESWLGQLLFVRSGRRMAPTAAALLFASEVRASFDRMAAAAEQYGSPQARRILRVSAPASFAMFWLIPRLEGFHASHPGVEVVVTTVSTVQEEVPGGIDVAIRRGTARPGAWPRYRAIPVLEETDTLIMAPALAERDQIREAADVERHRLLASHTRAGDWIDWLDAAGLAHLSGRPRRMFDHFYVTRQAVLDGLGVGIGPLPMLAADVAAGRLLTPLPGIAVRRPGYVALAGVRQTDDPLSKDFIDWLALASARRTIL